MSTISDAGLECALCHESYAAEIRTPRVLHGCGHTVCQTCCSALVDVSAPIAQVVCPFDRIVTLLTEPCIFSLKKNYALIEIIERHKKFTQSDHISSLLVDEVPPSEYMKDILLGIPCDEDPKHTAIFFCTVCESNMCSECSKRTHTGRVLSKHCRVPVSEKPLSRTMCPYHSAYAIEFVCQEVECLENNRLMCLLCRDYGRHRNHRHSLLEVEAAGLRERVREALSDFRSFISDLNGWNIRVTQTVTEIMDENEGSHVIARRQVEAHFRRLREELEIQEQTAMSQLDAHVADRIEALRHHQQELAFITSQVTAVSAQLQESSEMDDARLIEQQTDLIKMLDAVRTHQSDIASAPSGLSLDTRIPFSFTADNRIHMGSNVDIRLVILGLDGAGKTTILYKLKSDECRQSTTTVGFNVETIQYKNFKLTMWDVGGMPKLRRLWKHYFMNTQALVFVIDSSCPSRFGEAQNELAKIFAERELVDACFLVILNRRQPTTVNQHCGVSSAAIDQLVMNINRFSAGRTVMIHQCNAMTGIGLWEAIDALTSKLLLARNQTEILDVEDQSDEIGELEVEAETQTSDPYCSNNLMQAMRVANETLARIEQRERNFYKTYGRHENDFLNDFISVSKQLEGIISKQFMKRFDQLISNVNEQLKIIQAKAHDIPESHSNQATVLRSETSDMGKFFASKIDEENPSSEQDDSNQLAEINNELMELEQRIFNIEMRMQGDVEAEEIGIEFPISDIIDYMTAIKVTMYKRHMLTNELHRIVLNNEKFEEEAKLLTKDFAIWTKAERDDLLTKMTQLEESLSRLQQFPLIYGDEFNRQYPLMADLNHLKHLVSWFLDKYEINSSEVPTARLTPSFSLFQPKRKETDSKDQINVAKSAISRAMKNSVKKGSPKNTRKHEVLSEGDKKSKI